MLTPEQEERLEIIRRSAERGKRLAEEYSWNGTYLDIFVHILDELARIK